MDKGVDIIVRFQNQRPAMSKGERGRVDQEQPTAARNDMHTPLTSLPVRSGLKAFKFLTACAVSEAFARPSLPCH